MGSRLGIALLVSLAAIGLAACGGRTATQNADEFRDKVIKTGYEVQLKPEREGRPDLVEGTLITEDDLPVDFAFAFGPAPSRKLPPPAKDLEAVWFNAGDEVYFWVQQRFIRDKKKLNRYYDALFEIEDTACQVVADRGCGV